MQRTILTKALNFVAIIILCITMCSSCTANTSSHDDEYVDLALSSKTKWKCVNERYDDENELFTYDEAVGLFGYSIPTNEQWMELVNECEWEWIGMGYRIVGRNGNSITLPAEGFRDKKMLINRIGTRGDYWSSTPYNSMYAWYFCFFSSSMRLNDNGAHEYGRSVRLVK